VPGWGKAGVLGRGRPSSVASGPEAKSDARPTHEVLATAVYLLTKVLEGLDRVRVAESVEVDLHLHAVQENDDPWLFSASRM